MSIPSNGKDDIRKTIANALTIVSHASTPFINVFLFVHLASPILANVGGTSLASRVMLLGREYYQTRIGEFLTLGGIGIHAASGLSKRLLLSYTSPSKSQDEDGKSSDPRGILLQRPLKSLLSLTAYSALLFLLPIHFLVHRDYPTIPTEPIAAVGPASLDYEYVKYGLHTWPWRSWLLYGGLVGSVMFHFADGATVIWNTWLKDSWLNVTRRTRRSIFFWGFVAPTLLGLAAITREPPMIMSFLKSGYHAAYTQSIVYRV
ncbi:hypothetical protein AN958_11059 [Leucoagaricus sp. SymC.cos]|nr:hypothetical protein AN958_11059 [Leucoagaricus sp. SymC.cos]